jgi:hypothetical protein
MITVRFWTGFAIFEQQLKSERSQLLFKSKFARFYLRFTIAKAVKMN